MRVIIKTQINFFFNSSLIAKTSRSLFGILVKTKTKEN